MNRLDALRAVNTLGDLALLLGFKPQGLAYLVYVKPSASKYKAFTIPKKTGGTREIRAPDDDLKNLQARLADLLQDCDEHIRFKMNLRRAIAHGFVRKKSIMSNASQHLHRRFVLNVDIENFFGSINFGRVRGFFIKNKNFALSPKIATILAQIVCYENSLPQGAPTSPIVSNLIAHILDVRLARLSAKLGCTYSRYADDLTFSINKRQFPSELATADSATPHSWKVGDYFRQLVHEHGFALNDKKTRLQYSESRQQVTGLVVNRKVNVRAEYRLHVRQMVNRLCNTGKFQFVPSSKAVSEEDKADGSMGKLAGMLSFINSVRNFEIERHKTQVGWLSNQKTFIGMYQKFLLYKDFYGADRPVLLTEGKTDIIYLRCAIRQLASKMPNLAKVDAKGKTEVLPRLFRHTKTTADILGLNGGSGDLLNFISMYRSKTERFKAEKSPYPIILVIDNDKGAKGIYTIISSKIKTVVTGKEDFYKISDHVYIVPTPKNKKGEDTCIEDLFDPVVLTQVINGKTFNPNKDSDASKHYGKFDFARYVVKANEAKIDFSGFISILGTIDSIIKNHANSS